MNAIPNGSHQHQHQHNQQQHQANGSHHSSNNNNMSRSTPSSSVTTATTTTTSTATVNAHLVWPIVIRPLLCKIQKRSQFAAVTLLNALGKAENAEPGFLLELVTKLLQHHHQQQFHHHQQQQQFSNQLESSSNNNNSNLPTFRLNMTESLLRLQANIPEIEEQRCRRLDEPFQELNRKTFALKKILSRIPDEIDDRKVFLETIKEIASAIKKLLDCVNEITAGGYLSSYMDKRAVEGRKREFIKDSKNFSQTLKEFFKGGHEQAVFQSAAQLIYATNSIQKTIKSRCDQKN